MKDIIVYRTEVYPEEMYKNFIGCFKSKTEAWDFIEEEYSEMRKRNLDVSYVNRWPQGLVVVFKDTTKFEYIIEDHNE